MKTFKITLSALAILATTTAAFAAGGGTEQTLANQAPAVDNVYAPTKDAQPNAQVYVAPTDQSQATQSRDYESATREGPSPSNGR